MTADRSLAAVLFTDIVGSTRRAADLGDDRWRELLDRHHALVRRWLRLYAGTEIKTAGDGFLVVFESPARALACADAIRNAVRDLDLGVRCGVHVGEVERKRPRASSRKRGPRRPATQVRSRSTPRSAGG
ncbi:MAG: adenylate/guanylate cyclase domain-containing protein, partial [Gemmatimonadota bacterium]